MANTSTQHTPMTEAKMEKLEKILSRKIYKLIEAAAEAGYCRGCTNATIFGLSGGLVLENEGLDYFKQLVNETLQAAGGCCRLETGRDE